MTREEAAARIRALTDAVRDYARRYYQDDRPLISDAEYDALLAELEALEQAYPELADPDSPTRRVGAPPRSDLPPVHFERPVLSLNNVHSLEELDEFVERVVSQSGAAPEFVGELKIDGLSVVLRYEAGRLVQAATRGDGLTGEDVTPNAREIPDVPKVLRAARTLEVRGEVYMSRSRFAALNRERATRGEEPFANPRNAAAGSLRQLNPAITRERGLSLFCYEIRAGDEEPPTQAATLERLAALGFPVEPHWALLVGRDALRDYITRWEGARRELDYDTDGLVIKLNDLEAARRLGNTLKAPRAQVAFKYPPEVAVTRVTNIHLSVGRTGAVTPTAELEPVRLAGTTVTRASLHNANILAALDVRIGDWVAVRKAGEIIPEVVDVLKDRRTGDEQPFVYPDRCPECGTPLVREADEVEWRCPARFTCPAQRREALLHFGSRAAMDIEGLGEKTVDLLLSHGLVHTPADLYRLSEETVAALPRFGPVAAHNLVEAIQRSKEQPLSRLLTALNIRHVGEKAAKVLADRFGTLDRLMAATQAELEGVEGIGPVVAASLVAFFQDAKQRALIEEFRQLGLNFAEPKAEVPTGILRGETIVVTGTLSRWTRSEVEALIERLGGKTAESVSRRTSFVLAGERPGSKVDRARALGIPILSEEEFWERVSRASPMTGRAAGAP